MAAEFTLGYYLNVIVGYIHSDAISRVANAFYVLYSRDPHLGAIGFVWNPLPSLIEVFILILYPIFPALAHEGLAATLQSSVFAALTTVLLYNAGRRFNLSPWLSLGLALSYSLNPFVFLFGANGLSDAPYVFFLMMTVAHFSWWVYSKGSSTSALITSSFALALAFWTRYEAVPFGVSLALAVMIAVLFMQRERVAESAILDNEASRAHRKHMRKERWYKVEATWILLLLPAVFSGLLWIFFNYIIMDDALYFLRGEYSNVAQSEALKNDPKFQQLFGHPWRIFLFALKKTLWFSIPLLCILFIRLLNGRLLRWDVVILIALISAVPGLQYILLLKESSFGWFRYFMYVFPVTVAWLPYELGLLAKGWKQRLGFTVVIAGMLGTAGLLTYAMTQPSIAPDENYFLQSREDNGHYVEQVQERNIAAALDRDYKDATILVDSYSAYNIIISSTYPRKFLITSDYLFQTAAEDPPGNDIDYILLPKPKVNTPTSELNRLYPEMYDRGNSWATLVQEFEGDWRMYKVKKWDGKKE
ncbi:hypothetical protein SY83_03375 [Paenibacillus swuensis]|uniref:Glycosyltransferase RgtA/B/C/D-like domain-containing protein n=1 Tax=Paenibacillus swuensis TaxID=1178515 RepID=A0A172TP60_9BACL|nr:hypothetical protein [Paenibacillus swuensis]ANE48694.1 hypothetical protein SY83_03375 [Paenibacillus swuensis]